MTAGERFARLPTAGKLLLILTAVLLPIGIALAWMGYNGIRQASVALEGRNQDQSRAAANAIESLIARNALALRIAANGALSTGADGACDRTQRSLSVAPAVSQSFELETSDGNPICAIGSTGDTVEVPLVAPGDIRVRISPDGNGVAIRTGVINGMATGVVTLRELRSAAAQAGGAIETLVLQDGDRELRVIGPAAGPDLHLRLSQWPLSNGNLAARIGVLHQRINTGDRLIAPGWSSTASSSGRSSGFSRRSSPTGREAGRSTFRKSSDRAKRSGNCATLSAARSSASRNPSARRTKRWTASAASSARSITG